MPQSEDFKNIKVIAMDPGVLADSRSYGTAHVPFSFKAIFGTLNRLQPVLKLANPRMQRAGSAARDLVDLTLDKEFEGMEGHFEVRKKKDSSPASMDEGMQARVWQKSLEWSGIGQGDMGLAIGSA
jgi:hypothetical protein